MKLVLHTLIIFFGIVAVAALVALGEPSAPEVPLPAAIAAPAATPR